MNSWTDFGRLPGANVAAAFVTLLLAVALLASPLVAVATWFVTLVGYAFYCVARPIGGGDCFAAFAGPMFSAWVIHLASGLPERGVAAIMLALGLIALMLIDREDGLAPAS
jgi:hypothetical protein